MNRPNWFEEFLAALNSVQMEPYRNAELIAKYLGQPETSAYLLKEIESGLELNISSSGYLAATRGQFYERMRGAWSTPDAFTDDSKFSNTRFHLATNFWKDTVFQEPEIFPTIFAAAHDQVTRMLAAGRMDVKTLKAFEGAALIREPETAAFVFAHDDERASRLDADMAKPFGPTRWRVQGAADLAISEISAKVLQQAVHGYRKQAFRDHWLRAAVSDSEYDSVKDLAFSTLQHLYESVWSAGYEGYRARMLTLRTELKIAGGSGTHPTR